MAPVIKIAGGELGQRSVRTAGGGGGRLWSARPTTWLSAIRRINPAAEMFEMRRVTVGSGTAEIKRNIIAKRVLGLPS